MRDVLAEARRLALARIDAKLDESDRAYDRALAALNAGDVDMCRFHQARGDELAAAARRMWNEFRAWETLS